MRVNAATREVICKVVYYGPGMSGKTTNLKVIHDRSPRQSVGELVTLDTHSERTLHFDLLPMDVGTVRGFSMRFEFFTVPGQSYYAATRRLVLEGADGVVFVADSRREALDENIDSMNDLLDNLRHHQLPDDMPVVIQYNKQDLPTALKPDQLDPLLNIRRSPRFTAIATSGAGVLETLKAITNMVVERAAQHPALSPQAASAPSGANPIQHDAGGTPQPWLITCYRCLNMLETQNAHRGDMFTCGACGTALEIIDIEHGLTRAPQHLAQPAAQPAAQRGSGSGSQPGLQSGSSPGQRGVGSTSGQQRGVGSGSQPGMRGVGSQAAPGRPAGDESAYGMQALPDGQAGALRMAASGSQQIDPPSGGTPFEIDGFDHLALLDETVQGRRHRVRERATGARYRALVINPMLVRQPGYLPQVEPYARMANQVKHPHILPLAGLRPGRETPVLLSGDPPDHEALSHVLARRRTLAPPHAIGVIRMLALALEEAARHGVVHGWLRPDVILLNPDGNVLLDEIGLPKNHKYLVRELSGASAATEYYFAPEHLNDEIRSDVRSDMFLLGALTFRMVTGEGLITGYTAHEALHKVVANGCRTLRSVQPGVSRDLDAFVQRLVATERKDRFQTYRELIDVLDKFGGGAKRPTLRLTQNVVSPGTGGISRPTRAAVRGTANVRRSVNAGGTASHGRQSPINPDYASERRATSSSPNVLVWVIVLLLVLAAVGVGIVMSGGRGPQRITPAPGPTAKPTPPRMGPGTEPARPATPPPAPPKAAPATPKPPVVPAVQPTTPTPTPVAPVASVPKADPGAEVNRGDLLFEISQFERAEKFAAAIAACERLPSELAERRQDNVTRHATRRQEVEQAVGQAGTLAQVRTLLEPARSAWGMPGDVEWADGLLAQSQARLPADAATPPLAKVDPPPADPALPGAPPAPAPVAAVDAKLLLETSWAIDQALIRWQASAAEQALLALPPAAPETAALRRKIDVWNARAEIIDESVKVRKTKVRVSSPTSDERWDVVGADASGITATSPSGSVTRIDWNQLPIRELSRLCQEVAAAKAATVREHALATVMLVLNSDTVLASVQLLKAKAVADEGLQRDLEMIIGLRRQADVVDLLKRANEAAQAGTIKPLAEVLEQLHRADRAAVPEVASQLPRLDEALKQMQVAKTANEERLKDLCTFDSADDLASFATRDDAWEVKDGKASNNGRNATLGRKDLGTVRSATIIFQVNSGRGSLVVNFRGVRVIADFARSTVSVASKEQELKPKDIAFPLKASLSLYLEARAGQVSVEVNNGKEIFDVKAGVLTDQLSIVADTGANLSIEEVSLNRDARMDPVAESARQEAIRNLGLEPIGNARLDQGAISLPAGNGPRSGVAIPLRDNVASVTFEVKGKGKMRLLLGKLGSGEGSTFEFDLPDDPATPVRWTAGWTGGVFTVKQDESGFSKEVRYSTQPTHLMIIALQEATILSTPRPNRQ